MHVISCRARDEIRIGDEIRVTVLEVAEDRIRLGVTSPDQFPEYQELDIFRDGYGDEETDGTAEAGRQLVGA